MKRKEDLIYDLIFSDNVIFNIDIGDYIKDINNLLNPYIGIWKYEGNEMIFTLKIQKVNQFISVYNDGTYKLRDELLITYKFVKNGITLVDNLNEPIINTFYNVGNLIGSKYGSYWFKSLDSISGVITDIPLNITFMYGKKYTCTI